MCTVTYLPIIESGQIQGFVLTSNRDEKTARPSAVPPQAHFHLGHELVYPKDPQGNGSWIAISETGTVVCLLNGAFEKHMPFNAYKHSRGLVVLDYFTFTHIQDFVSHYDFQGIEPFTLVVVENGGLSEIRWDGHTARQTDFDPKMPHIWSSVTLYSPEIVSKREQWFQQWLEKGYDFTKIVDFHRFGGDGEKANDVLMNRDDLLKTVSISSIRNKMDSFEFTYEDLKNGEKYMVSRTHARIYE